MHIKRCKKQKWNIKRKSELQKSALQILICLSNQQDGYQFVWKIILQMHLIININQFMEKESKY